MKRIEKLQHGYFRRRRHWWGRLWLRLHHGKPLAEMDFQQLELRIYGKAKDRMSEMGDICHK